MASTPVRITAFSEQSPYPLRGTAPVTITPPNAGYLRLHVTLTDLRTTSVTFDIDVLPATEEVGHVAIQR